MMDKKIRLPANEAERLKALRELGILDTAADQKLDDITWIASQICGTPMALVSLVDENRQWFKSRLGLSATEMDREIAFCAHAIHEVKPFIIEDSLNDSRFSDNPWVVESPGIRFYAGAQLITSQGFAIGTLCVLDTQPKKLNPDQIKALEVLARLTVMTFERNWQTEKLKKALDGEMLTRESLQGIFSHFPIGIVQLDSEGQFSWGNPAFEKFLGFSCSELKKKTIAELIHPDEVLQFKELSKLVLSQAGGFDQVVHRFVHQTGAIVRGVVTGRDIRLGDSAERLVFFLIEDVTKVQKQEEEFRLRQSKLVESARMTSLGIMASGIAHEINNPLAILSLKTDLMKARIEKGVLDQAQLLTELEAIKTTVARIAKIVRGMQFFSHSSESDPKVPVFISKLINDTLDLCADRIKKAGVEIRINHLVDGLVLCRAADLLQIFLTLFNNSLDSIIRKESQGLAPEPEWLSINTRKENGHWMFVFTDSGQRISDDLQKKMMEPFFTTKKESPGAGLSLSIALGIARDYGGDLRYDPSSIHTCFLVNLPIYTE